MNRIQDVRRGGAGRRGQAWLAGWALAIAFTGLAAAGCGSTQSANGSLEADASGTVTVPVHETSRQAQAAAFEPEAESAPVAGQMMEQSASSGSGAMPPDIIVTASNTVVSPGEVIEIAVQATPDVTEMSLWDGINDRQALAYDAEAKSWRVAYRVPLRLPWERTGLAITARNDAQRWCRSWVFIEKERMSAALDTVQAEPRADAGSFVEPAEE